MAIEERDPLTGHKTTGHEWNGIKELNTPVPRAVYFFLIATTLFSLIYWIFMPAVPLGYTYTKGILGYDERDVIRRKLERAALEQAPWRAAIEKQGFDAIEADGDLMQKLREAGRALFGGNCAVCHGIDAGGNAGFPNLAAGVLNWGDSPEAIQETIRVGINSRHPDTRTAQMPAFGKEGMLPRADVKAVITYVRDIGKSGSDHAAMTQPKGLEIFQNNCAACHGDDARGQVDLGAPNLTDASWLYGGDLQTIHDTVWHGRQGRMPSWENRLGPVDIKILATYLHDLRKER
ncbi:cytochrome-c oxidase, cbb3-type subunit III [Sinorhizobium mexicanum]|uniref:Cbb3-type cytochrome c oxidase subunit n=1 Tax=Sinorhizobium mexicanum TaxID=375549 RepID=A0A859QHP4_9HYPH|nr:cytochrome-c oxidase, cbb3-type subunit III [Sinorhizobium mexicanum]MBP1887989.1 cytochrome c oxidase cbb3-type subunit 3 [Sinorhizobium mexicanum]QLL60027.1 cytochrome-c oxidase, cbb3-type subunit III [Sinorhizobium mexicanum]